MAANCQTFEPQINAEKTDLASRLDSKIGQAYSLRVNVNEGLRMLSLLSVVLLRHRDREAVCGPE